MSVKLVRPGPEHERAAKAFLAEFRAAGDDHIYGSGGLQRYEQYADWLRSLDETPPDHVKQTTFFSFDEDVLVGTIAVRHALNEHLRLTAGHIGYSVRPSMRRKGYAKEQLRLALDVCRECGISHALVTCNEFNIASAATILAFDGVEDRPYREEDGTVVRRFWIATGEPAYTALNSEAWDQWVADGIQWGIPITREEFARAKSGALDVHLGALRHVPCEWFPALDGANVLCLAGGGGQQAPLLAAHGAHITVFDNSARQLATERMVAEREGYDISLIKGDMTRRLPFEDETFELVIHPISNCYVENVQHIWREAYRVLKKGGVLIAGVDNGITFLFNDYEALTVENQLPFNPLRDGTTVSTDDGVQFSHTLAEQIGGQLRAGFRLTDLLDDYDATGEDRLGKHTPLFIMTRAVKEERDDRRTS